MLPELIDSGSGPVDDVALVARLARLKPIFGSSETARDAVAELKDDVRPLLDEPGFARLNAHSVWWDSVFAHSPEDAFRELARQLHGVKLRDGRVFHLSSNEPPTEVRAGWGVFSELVR